ncbi:Phosphatidylinositol-3-phosphatase SAC1 [Sporothrix eucalyptigena]|uniref:Phosphatidylinositol-3-phosphatase SAC1 n=1 Tax=Sporothrix eucalyptigena TaxID=1812306 RepID=A0ABP0CZK3_9PEZI
MSHLDVEALLDAAASGSGKDVNGNSTANGGRSPRIDDSTTNGTIHTNGHSRRNSNSRSRSRSPRGGDRGSDHERERDRADRERADRDRDRRRREDQPRSQSPRGGGGGSDSGRLNSTNGILRDDDRERTPARSETGSHRSSRRRSRSPRRRRRNRGHGGGGRSRSRSPNRYYRPRDSRRDRDDDRYSSNRDRSPRDRSRDRGDRYGRDRSRESRRGGGGRSLSPPNAGERDRRTVFVQQLAARLRTRELKEFFEKAGPVAEAQIVKDRVSNRSKGVGYVEFKSEETIAAALQLTGQKLLGIPVIVQVTEAEKNRQVRNTADTPANGTGTGAPFHRLYVGNIHFSITESDLRNVFEPFGELEFVQLQKDDTGRSRGYGFVQFRDSNQAREALEKMNGFDLAGRPIRVGLGNDKFTPESTAHLMQRFQGRDQNGGGRDSDRRGGSGSGTFDRAGARDNDKGSGAGALDDTDVAGVNFNNYSRDALMRKLARTDDVSVSSPSSTSAANGAAYNSNGSLHAGGSDATDHRSILKPRTDTKPLVGVNVNLASRCVVLHNMFDPAEEEGDDWVKELEDDVRQEAEEKYGHVMHVALDVNSKGDIYLKFDKVQGGENAIKGLNGRYFGGRMITAAPVVDAVYSSLFSRTKAM